MMGLFPKTGAGDGNKDWKAKTKLRGMDTGARYEDEKRKKKNQAKVDKHAEKLARKKGYGIF